MIAPPKSPSHDELEALIKEARERQLRRRLLRAAGVAILAALGLCVYALTLGDRGHAKLNGGTENAGVALCRSAQLSATAGLNGAVGTMLGPVVLTNTGGSACSLPAGRPSVRILSQGTTLPARETALDVAGETPVQVLAPHSTAMITMDWSNWCGKPSAGSIFRPTFRLQWSDGLRVDAPNNALTPPRCDSPGTGSAIAVSVPEKD